MKPVFSRFLSILYFFLFLLELNVVVAFVTLLFFVFFGYGQLCCVTLSSRASFHVCK